MPTADDADRVARVAPARLAATRQRAALIETDARDRDRARAEADLLLARAQLEEAQALHDKTIISAPPLVELEDGRELPLGLRVQAFIERR